MQRLRTLTAKQAKAIDIKARDKLGISTLMLMENAGASVVRETVNIRRPKDSSVAVFCGKGNNGGDGFVAARHLLTAGVKTSVYLCAEPSEVRNEAQVNLGILINMGKKLFEVNESNLKSVIKAIPKYGLIIDAIFGVGLKNRITGIYRELIGAINTSGSFVLSVDIPSGLDATSGEILGCCVKANKTVTFVAPKRGMLIGDGRKNCGKIVVRDLGIPV